MMRNPHSHQPYILGIDGGGTKCSAHLFNLAGDVVGVGMGGAANAYQSLQTAQESILTSASMALADAKVPLSELSNIVAGVGLAGVNVPSVLDAMNAWRHPFKQMYITNDLHIACLGAHNQRCVQQVDSQGLLDSRALKAAVQTDGAVIVIGTGSCGYVQVNGCATVLGGHGFPIGDQGSAAWMGFEAVRAALLAQDGLGEATALCDLISAQWNTPLHQLHEKIRSATSADFAQLARCVVVAGMAQDAVARNIMQAGAAYIDRLTNALMAYQPARISVMGGLSEALLPWLEPLRLNQFSPPLNSAEYGGFLHALLQSTQAG